MVTEDRVALPADAEEGRRAGRAVRRKSAEPALEAPEAPAKDYDIVRIAGPR